MANTLKICGETYTGVNGLIVKDDNGNEIILQDEASIQSALDDFVNGTLTTYIDSSLTSFANYAFQNFSSLQTVITPNVTSIGNYAFQNCSNLSSITTGSLTSIGDYCFQGTQVSSFSNNWSGVTNIGQYAFQGRTGIQGQLVLNAQSAVTIGDFAFDGCTGITEIVHTAPLILGNKTLQGCANLTSITLPNNSRVLDSTFKNCSSLTQVVCDGDLQSNTWNEQISGSCFSGCSNCTLYDFSHATFVWRITTNAAVYVFQGINPNAKIVVPDALYNDYINHSSWSTVAQYIISASDYANL